MFLYWPLFSLCSLWWINQRCVCAEADLSTTGNTEDTEEKTLIAVGFVGRQRQHGAIPVPGRQVGRAPRHMDLSRKRERDQRVDSHLFDLAPENRIPCRMIKSRQGECGDETRSE